MEPNQVQMEATLPTFHSYQLNLYEEHPIKNFHPTN